MPSRANRSRLSTAATTNTAALFCRVRRSLAKIIERQLAAAYPDLAIERLDEAAIAPPTGTRIHTAELRLVGDVMPIETCDAFEDRLSRELNDPIAGLLGLLAAGPQLSRLVACGDRTRARVAASGYAPPAAFSIATTKQRCTSIIAAAKRFLGRGHVAAACCIASLARVLAAIVYVRRDASADRK